MGKNIFLINLDGTDKEIKKVRMLFSSAPNPGILITLFIFP